MTDLLLRQVLNWIVLGSIYALIAVGFSLLFGVLDIIHFSHGDVSLVAPFLAPAVVQTITTSLAAAGASPVLLLASLVLAVAMTGALGVLFEMLVIRRFRGAPVMMALVATVALGIVLRELIRHLFPNGSNPHPFPRFVSGQIAVGGVTLPLFSLAAVLCAVIAVLGLSFLMNRTRLGLHIRAVSQDPVAAHLLSIRPNRIFRGLFRSSRFRFRAAGRVRERASGRGVPARIPSRRGLALHRLPAGAVRRGPGPPPARPVRRKAHRGRVRRQPARGGADRHRHRPGRAPAVPGDHGARQHPPRLRGPGRQGVLPGPARRDAGPVPARRGAHLAAGRHAVGRRAGNGGAGEGVRRLAAARQHGRALARPLAQADRRVFRHGRRGEPARHHGPPHRENAETALSIADRGVMLVKGRIVASRKASDLLESEELRHLYL